jgi:hypothetical protein
MRVVISKNGHVNHPGELWFPLGEALKSSGMVSENMHSRQFNEKEVNAA